MRWLRRIGATIASAAVVLTGYAASGASELPSYVHHIAALVGMVGAYVVRSPLKDKKATNGQG